MLFLALVFCAFSWVRCSIYEDEATLWRDVALKSPGKARVHNNFGDALKKSNRLEEARRQFELAIDLDPAFPSALNNLAAIYSSLGRKGDSRELLLKALSLNPGHLQAKSNLALLYYETGILDEAAREYESIILLSPLGREAGFARHMLSLIQRQRGAP